MNAEDRYRTLNNLAANVPDFHGNSEDRRWLGILNAVLQDMQQFADSANLTIVSSKVFSIYAKEKQVALNETLNILYRAIGIAELSAPTGIRGAFINAGNELDGFSAVGSVLGSASSDVMIVDPYMDDKAVTDFGVLVGENVKLMLLADSHNVKTSLKPAVDRWIIQYASTRPIETRLAPPKSLHDRLIIIDLQSVWVLTQSLKDFAKRSPASIVKVDPETSALKVTAYTLTWDGAAAI